MPKTKSKTKATKKSREQRPGWEDPKSNPLGQFKDAIESARAAANPAAVEAWVDRSMYHAEAMEVVDGLVQPRVYLLDMTHDPLGAVASQSEIYTGSVIRSMAEVTDELRRKHLDAMPNTALTSPLEEIKFHFLIEGVDRSFTHQLVRNRMANYGQESLRFAVKDNLAAEVAVPPSVAELPKHHPTRQMIDKHNAATQELVNFLVGNGIPAEDARGYYPHVVTTRIHFEVNMRSLIHHAGLRLCTQAQLVWRDVFTQMREAVRTFTPDFSWIGMDKLPLGTNLGEGEMPGEILQRGLRDVWEFKNRWQFEALADAPWWRPGCYQEGHCIMNASFDRGCTIRERVELNAATGIHSSEWAETHHRFDPLMGTPVIIKGIEDSEWMLDRKAAYL